MKQTAAFFKKGDILIIALALCLSLTPLAALALSQGESATVTVTQAGQVLYSGPLSEDAVIVTPDGGNTVTVQGGRVTMTDAHCPDRLCTRGEATALHPLICLPNLLTVTVTDAKEAGPDAVTY